MKLKTARDGRSFHVRRPSGLVLSATPINSAHGLTKGVNMIDLLAWDNLLEDDLFSGTFGAAPALRLMSDFIEAETDRDALLLLKHVGRRKGLTQTRKRPEVA